MVTTQIAISVSPHFPRIWAKISATLWPRLGSDDDAGIEDQTHEGGFQGLRLRAICSTSAATSGSSVKA